MPIPLLIIAAPTIPLAKFAFKSAFTRNLNIAILGTKAAGKTTLINTLQTGEVTANSQATSYEESVNEIDATWTKNNMLEKMKILINEKKSSFFKKPFSKRTGTDVPGDASFRQTYEDYIEGKDILFLLFDISHYLDCNWDSKDGGKREAQALFDFIYDRRDTLASHGKIFLMATHKDKLDQLKYPNDTSILDAFRQSLKGKPYYDLCQNCVPVNLISQEILEQIKNLCEEH